MAVHAISGNWMRRSQFDVGVVRNRPDIRIRLGVGWSVIILVPFPLGRAIGGGKKINAGMSCQLRFVGLLLQYRHLSGLSASGLYQSD